VSRDSELDEVGVELYRRKKSSEELLPETPLFGFLDVSPPFATRNVQQNRQK